MVRSAQRSAPGGRLASGRLVASRPKAEAGHPARPPPLPLQKIIPSHCQDVLSHIVRMCFRILSGCAFAPCQDALFAPWQDTLFTYTFCGCALRASHDYLFCASIGALILRTCFDTPAPLSKNRVPRIMAHKKIKSLKTRNFQISTYIFRHLSVSP
jgi:hypothetical protein